MRTLILVFSFVLVAPANAQTTEQLAAQKSCFALAAENNAEFPANIKASCEKIKADIKKASDADNARRKQQTIDAINNAAKGK